MNLATAILPKRQPTADQTKSLEDFPEWKAAQERLADVQEKRRAGQQNINRLRTALARMSDGRELLERQAAAWLEGTELDFDDNRSVREELSVANRNGAII